MPFDGAIEPLVLWFMPECEVFAFVFVVFIFDCFVFDAFIDELAAAFELPVVTFASGPTGDPDPVEPVVWAIAPVDMPIAAMAAVINARFNIVSLLLW